MSLSPASARTRLPPTRCACTRGYRPIAPDMRGFGDSGPAPSDAGRGLPDWADDTHALVRALGIEQPVHLAGWSTGGAAVANPELVRRLAARDRSHEPLSPRSEVTGAYWSPHHREPREELPLDELLKSVVGDDHHPGDWTPSEHWPGVAPGTRGIRNALSLPNCDWTRLVDVDPKPPVLSTCATEDGVIAAGSAWDIGTLGESGAAP